MIAAIDCDLRKHYAVRSDGAVLFSGLPFIDVSALVGVHLVLFEIASAKDYHQTNQAAAYATRRWMLWNVAMASMTHTRLAAIGVIMLVAPSSAWTKGYTLAQRHKIAGCIAKKKDVRECEAMIHFYHRDPTPWQQLAAYLETI